MSTPATPNLTLPAPRVPFYPLYNQVRAFLRLMHGQSRRTLFSMRDSISKQHGTPQQAQDWTNPDEWIPEILQGGEQILAEHLWRGSKGLFNPRHLTGTWLLVSSYQLLAENDETLYISEWGENFLNQEFGDAEKRLDYAEGLLHLLSIIAEHGPAWRGGFLPHLTRFLQQYSQIKSQSAINSRWYYLASNLLDRKLIERSGLTYQIQDRGLQYLEENASVIDYAQVSAPSGESLSDVRRLLSAQEKHIRTQLHETLLAIDPYRFEFLVKRLLEAIGYNDVEVTRSHNDGGVDVVADIEVGITTVREVVQVKRYQGSISRPVLDQLRGSLHRFDAQRGTIISTGRFSKGMQEAAFERGAAPITLIDGDKLIDLFIEHEIGVRKEQIRLLKFEPTDFILDEEQVEIE